MNPEQLLPGYIASILTADTPATHEAIYAVHVLDQARGELGAALTQTIPSDDQIIVEHMRTALKHLDALRPLLVNAAKGGSR